VLGVDAFFEAFGFTKSKEWVILFNCFFGFILALVILHDDALFSRSN